MDIKLIVAHDENNGIGKNNKLAWNCPSDLKRFQSLTKDSIVICGRNTYESILESNNGKLLDNRYFIIISNTLTDIDREKLSFKDRVNSQVFSGNREQLNGFMSDFDQEYQEICELNHFDFKNVFVIGGAKLYKELHFYCKYWYVSEIHGHFDCDAIWYVNWNQNALNEIYKVERKDHTFKIYENKGCIR